MPHPAPNDHIAVWFSCGAASAVAAYETLRLYATTNTVRIINNPVLEEDEDNRRFLRDVEQWLGVPIETATNKRYPTGSAADVWATRRFMSSVQGASCTMELKRHARQQWEAENRADWHVLGFTADERSRYDKFILTERPNILPILIDAGYTKQDCINILQRAGLTLPRVYAMGYPNANCIGCVKATSPTYWNHVRTHHPDVFAARATQSRDLGVRLVRVNNERIFLDELDPTATGRPLKSITIECGIFCEEREEA